MIDTTQEKLIDSLDNAIEALRYKSKNNLYSYTEKINSIDSVALYASAEMYKGTRMFWTSPDNQLVLIGFGSTSMLHAEQNRFNEIDRQWNDLIEKAIIDNSYQLPGTGPILMGGFSFDETEESDLWKNFQSNKMVIPEFLVTTYKGVSYLTYNVLINEESSPEKIAHYLQEQKAHFLGSKNHSSVSSNRLIEAEDVLGDKWKNTIVKATKQIELGSLDKVVLARELKVKFGEIISIPNVLNNLLEQQKNSYVFAMESEDDCFIGATPERLVKVEANELLSTCLAGTAPRGETMAEDEVIGQKLLEDEKNLQEHAFVVDMIKMAVEACCDEIEVPTSPVLLPLKNLQHLYTPVRATLKKEYSLLEVVKRLHPTPAMGGVPREKALQFIREDEDLERGWYSAPIGWMDASGNGEFAVAIRSGLVKANEASLFAGCGIVKDSSPEKEYQETEIKFQPMLAALGG
ncbi:menaquinone-specific isochorismate synthase [Salirhabdus euzebyi]|uniref:Isochorismate synthase MenF n=1 Tax=Salirhabdus euzebyi TaxID=394506 RepID=A0A841Q4T7_9BACI|nr:isochorismate synthase [Salirhabdus euzebyi]MBB6453405.1 menaquinone-specific isochorismate synthase [Salirhabdus euzebyi]